MLWPICAELAQRALVVAMCAATPVLAVVLVAGVLVNLLQGSLAHSDPTTAAVPRLLAFGLAVLVFGAWMVSLLADFWSGLWSSLPGLLR